MMLGNLSKALTALAVALCLGANVAEAAPGRAELVMDARSGEILHEKNAQTRLHPASLTKMMTLYLVFEAVETGRLGLDQRVRVSREAARQPASKVGFKAGQRVRIRDLIRSAAVRSANDSAVVLAEAVSGSEAEFAKLMTRRARQLGMNDTTFKNASGLTSRGHLSTARDMALLGLRLFYDYPEYYNLFGRRSTPAFGRTFWNTNRLLGQYRGMDGIKTGYTRAAGFNLVSSAERDDVRLIAAVFGGSSSKARNAQMARLLDRGFRLAPAEPRGRVSGGMLLAALSAPPPSLRPDREAGGASLFARDAATAIGRALGPSAAHAATPTAPRGAFVQPTELAALSGPRPTRRGGLGDWSVSLGEFAGRDAAVANLAAAALGAMPALAAAGREVDAAPSARGSLFSARLTGLDRTVAAQACAQILRTGGDCAVVAPGR
jgi:D-alanyl-D-alanine carboxypeptidase